MSQGLREMNANKTPSRRMGELSIKTPNSGGRRVLGNLNKSWNQSFAANANKRAALKKREMTPTRNSSYVANSVGCGDRFMSFHKSDQEFDLANHLMNQNDVSLNTSTSAPTTPAKSAEAEQMVRMMRAKSASNLTDAGDDERILCYKKSMAPKPPPGYLNHAKVLYSAACIQPSSSVKKATRTIPTECERILDAPEYNDDFYSNVLDWSVNGIVAVALGYALYLWNADTGTIEVLFESRDFAECDLITAVKWSGDGRILSVGFRDGRIKVFDPTAPKKELRTLKIPRVSRNGVICWNGSTITAGYQSGTIVNHDVRVRDATVGTFVGHTQDVVGLDWQPASGDNKLLASGSCDFSVRLFDSRRMSTMDAEAIHVIDDHIDQVRAVKFCHFKPNLLATGGGLTDHSIKVWNVDTKELVKTWDAASAVNGFVFNSDYMEMASVHADGQLRLYQYPSWREIACLDGHKPDRCMSIVTSACGQFAQTIGGDETLRTWHLFKVDKSTRKMQERKKMGAASFVGIR